MASVRHLGLFPIDQSLGIPCWNSEYYSDPDIIVRLTLAQALCLFWRVKTFEFNCPWNGMTIRTNLLGAGVVQEDQLIIPSNEKQLMLCDLYLDKAKSEGSFDVGASLLQFSIRQENSFNPLGPLIGFIGHKSQEEDPSLGYTFTNSPGSGSKVGSINFEFGPINSSSYFSTSLDAFGNTDTAVSGEIKAVEYWPYDPGDGLGPIYDSATGAQLRAFPST